MDKIDEWHLDRKGRFSASQAWKLFSNGGNEMFGRGAWTYIQDRAVDMLTKPWERPWIDEVDSILHGRAHEYPAYARYIQETRNFSVKYLGDLYPIFITHPDFPDEFGGTPDAADITDDGSVVMGVEIKCPKDPIKHMERLLWKNQWDIKEAYPLCYAQIQSLLMITGAPEWHFVSYDERQKLNRTQIVIIPVSPDKNFQSNLTIRLKQAIKEKYKIISEYLGIEVSNRDQFLQKVQIHPDIN